MTEFIGARISLISRADIRYVGTLHEIDSETSTVALENVKSFGTEGRKNDPSEEIPAADNLYEYIVFRGSDVKDLRIEEAPTAKENKPPQMPNDPAILSGSRPPPARGQPPRQKTPQAPQPPQQTSTPTSGPPGIPGGPAGGPPPFGQHPQYPPFYPPPPAGWGRGGPPAPGFPGMPYGAPPGWYPPPGQGFPHPPGPFPPYGYPPGPPGQQFLPGQPQKPAPIGPGANKQQSPTADKQAEPKSLAKPAAEMAAAAVTKAPTPLAATKPASEVKAEETSASQSAATAATTKSAAPTGPKGRVQPVIPLASPAISKAPLQASQGNVASPPAQPTPSALNAATQAATAAVAAAMAKLPPVGGQTNGHSVDNLTKKVNELRTNDPIRAPRNPGGASGFAQTRGSRGGRGGARNAAAKVEVPTTDFDFESSNAKFSKQDLVKEAIAGSPLGEQPLVDSPTESSTPVTGYNKSTSFFDNISSESKDRLEATNGRPGGREWRGEEQKKNVETFGEGSVDNGYRGGYRGRGGRRGGFRGRGYSGNGQPSRGRGGYRGRGDAQTASQ